MIRKRTSSVFKFVVEFVGEGVQEDRGAKIILELLTNIDTLFFIAGGGLD